MKGIIFSIITFSFLFSINAFADHKDKGGKSYKNIKRMEKIDKDGDGLISKKEMLDAHRVRINKMFSSYDENKDGKLSREEMRSSRKGMKKRHNDGKTKCGENNA